MKLIIRYKRKVNNLKEFIRSQLKHTYGKVGFYHKTVISNNFMELLEKNGYVESGEIIYKSINSNKDLEPA